ncbi:MAG: beta-Ala-His dipeptidase [Schwartzia sp. (in: firmicutes)]
MGILAQDEEILEGVLAEFEKLAAIPRPSGDEKAVSDYLYGSFSRMGCTVVQDEAYNVIADLAATAGYEAAPRTILQGHMDMVCVADEGVIYDPRRDPIRLVRTADYLSADGTSLGADDGAGVAEILYLFQHAPEPHGPLRAILTVDEESGMTGVRHLDAKYLTDAAFFLNCDSEEDDLLTVGSAGGLDMEFCRPLHWRSAEDGTAWQLMVGGLKGGHSGERIGDGRGNAIRVLAQLLLALRQAHIPIAVGSLAGGTARNAIAATASAVFVSTAGEAAIRRAMAEQKERFLAAYGSADPGITLNLTAVKRPIQVMAEEDLAAITELILVLHSGVYAMSPHLPGLVETSANLGLLRTDEAAARLTYYPRSSVDEKLRSFQQIGYLLGERFGCLARIGDPLPTWQEKPNSPLKRLAARVFEAQRRRTMRVAAIHAGLEVSFIVKKNPLLDVVSVGVTTLDIHSPKERLLLSTVAPHVRFLSEILRRIAVGDV